MFETDKILMTAVDTGWITDERPHRGEAADRRRGLARAARPGGRRRARLRPDRARRGRDRPVRLLREGLQALPLVKPSVGPSSSACEPAGSRLTARHGPHSRPPKSSTPASPRRPTTRAGSPSRSRRCPGGTSSPIEIDGLRIKPLEPLVDAEPPRQWRGPGRLPLPAAASAGGGGPDRVEQRALDVVGDRDEPADHPDPQAAPALRPRGHARRARLGDGSADGRHRPWRRGAARASAAATWAATATAGHTCTPSSSAARPGCRSCADHCLLDWEENLPPRAGGRTPCQRRARCEPAPGEVRRQRPGLVAT